MNPHGDISNLTLGERYGMELDDYIATEIPSVGLSVRVTNALMRNKITTVAQLLGMTMEQLRGMRNFGRLCEEELDTKLPNLLCSRSLRHKHHNVFLEHIFKVQACEIRNIRMLEMIEITDGVHLYLLQSA